MSKIEIGAGFLPAALAAFGLQGSIPIGVVLLVLGIFLVLHGGYEEYVKTHFRLDRRLSDWLQRRGWSVMVEPEPGFDFLLSVRDIDSGKDVVITRTKRARNDVLAFTGKVGLHPDWLSPLMAMEDTRRRRILEEIRIFLAIKNMGFVLVSGDGWPPNVVVQTAMPLDNSLSQHLVDMTAKSLTQAMIRP